MYADDTELIAHFEADLLCILDCFKAVSTAFGLWVKTKKTEVIYQPTPGTHLMQPAITINGILLNVVDNFKYLDSIVSWTIHPHSQSGPPLVAYTNACGAVKHLPDDETESVSSLSSPLPTLVSGNLDTLPPPQQMTFLHTHEATPDPARHQVL